MKIIAEIGINHNGDLNIAKQLAYEAVECGADVVKFQLYSAEKYIHPHCPAPNYQRRSVGDLTSQFDIIRRTELSADAMYECKEYVQSLGAEFLCTPFETSSLRILLDMGVKTIKVSSCNMTNVEFLENLAQSSVDVILSTGMCRYEEVEAAVNYFQRDRVAVLNCVSKYPARYEDYKLGRIMKLKSIVDSVGISDHSCDVRTPMIGLAMGYEIVEVHFKGTINLPGVDMDASLDKEAFSNYVDAIRTAGRLINSDGWEIDTEEGENRMLIRRGIYFTGNFDAGHVVSKNDLIFLRPVGTAPAESYYAVVGKRLLRSVEAFSQPQLDYLC